MLFTHFLDRGAMLNPGGDCLIEGDSRWTYPEVQSFSHRFGNRLKAAGFGPGDHGAVLAHNSAVAFMCAFGLHRAGLTWIPANPRSAAEDTRHVLDLLDCRILVFQSEFAEMVDTLRPELPKVRAYVCLDRDLDFAPSLERWLGETGDEPLDVYCPMDALAVLMPTGGTTGRSKGVMLTQRNLFTMIATYMATFVYTADERPVVMAAAPLTHASGQLALPALGRGGKVIILPRPDVALMLDTIEQHRVTEFFLPPTVIYRMLDHEGVETRDYSSLRYFAYAAAPMSVEKLKRALAVFGPCMTQFFGQSEAPALCTFLAPEDHFIDGEIAPDEVLSSCGHPTPLIELRILNDAGGECQQGDIGEVCVRGDLVTPGYYRDPVQTASTLVDGWLHTGDVGFIDGTGRLHLCDRKKDMIISGGLNIYPQEIEQILWAHPAVQDCAVIGTPHPEWGELVTAVVELNPGQDVAAEELLALCKTRLGSVKAPKRIEFVPSLPRSPAGKVLKRELRSQYWAGEARQI